MKIVLKQSYLFIIFAFFMHLSPVQALQWMWSNYWFAGYMYITGDPNLTYSIYSWNNTTKQNELSPVTFPTNTIINIGQLMDGVENCPYMWWGQISTNANGNPVMGGTTFLLVPSLPYVPGLNPSSDEEQKFQNDLLAGKKAPYIYIERIENIINIYILGPTLLANNAARKLSFNFSAFENVWVQNSPWYKKNSNPPGNDGMAFACSFNAFYGCFLNSPNQPLSNDSFYIYGMRNKAWPLGWSWTHQGPENTAIKNMTMSTLQSQGIVQHEQPFVPLNDLQRVISWVNATGQAKFANVITQ
jgi:hypothetical protein